MNATVIQILVGIVLSSVVFGFLAYLWTVLCVRYGTKRHWGPRRVWAMAMLVPPSVLLLIVPVLLGLAFGLTQYTGKCRGFTDSVDDCTQQQFITNQIFFAEMLTLYPTGMLVFFTFIFLGVRYFKSRKPPPANLPS